MVQIPGFTITPPPAVVEPGVATGVDVGATAAGAADVGAGASAALSGADLGVGGLGIASLVNIFDPSFFAGDPGASPAQIRQNQINLATAAGYPGTPAGIQAYIDATFKQQFGISPRTSLESLSGEFGTPAATTATDPTTALSLAAPDAPSPTAAAAAAATTPTPVFPPAQPGMVPADIASELEMGGGTFESPDSPYYTPGPSIDQPTADLMTRTATPAATGASAASQDLGRAIYSNGQFQGIEGVAPAAGGGGTGILGTGVSWGDALRYGGPLAALGMLGYTAMRGPQPLPQAAQQQVALTGPGSPVYAVSQKYLTEAATGVLQPGETAQIEQYRQNATNKLYQDLANSGVTDPSQDSRFVQGQATIEQNAQIMSQNFINAAVTNGINALGPTTTALTEAAQLQMENDQNYRQALASAAQALGTTAVLSTIASRA